MPQILKKIVLASKSPRRKAILNQIGLKFTIDISDIDETKFSHSNPVQLAKSLSKAKAEKIATKHKDAIIIAADTLVVLNNEIIGKPKSKEGAKEMLKKLSGKIHLVITGFTILDSQTLQPGSGQAKKEITKTVRSKVKFKKLSEREIEDYVETGEPLDKAGGYGVQDKGAILIESIVGDFYNVVGLPIFDLCQELTKFGIFVSDSWL